VLLSLPPARFSTAVPVDNFLLLDFDFLDFFCLVLVLVLKAVILLLVLPILLFFVLVVLFLLAVKLWAGRAMFASPLLLFW